jgi:D-alanine-D-alanine ligase
MDAVKPTVVIVHDSPAAGQEAQQVAAALTAKGFVCEFVAADRKSLFEAVSALATRRDGTVAFNLTRQLEGDERHGPLVPGLLALHGVRFTGNAASTLACAADRRVTKAILYAAGIPTPGGRVFRAVPKVDAVRDMAFPLVVKPIREGPPGAASPLLFAATPEELCSCVQQVLDTAGPAVLGEVYLEGRQFKVAVTGEARSARALPPTEVELGAHEAGAPRFVARDPGTRTRCPAEVGEHVKVGLATASVAAYRSLECRDRAFVTLRLDARGKPLVLGVDPSPVLSRDQDLARAVEASGDVYEDFLARLVEGAWSRS